MHLCRSHAVPNQIKVCFLAILHLFDLSSFGCVCLRHNQSDCIFLACVNKAPSLASSQPRRATPFAAAPASDRCAKSVQFFFTLVTSVCWHSDGVIRALYGFINMEFYCFSSLFLCLRIASDAPSTTTTTTATIYSSIRSQSESIFFGKNNAGGEAPHPPPPPRPRAPRPPLQCRHCF